LLHECLLLMTSRGVVYATLQTLQALAALHPAQQ